MDKSEEALSDSQRNILKQFKENVCDILTPLHTDSVLHKFLKGKNYNLRNTERNFRQVDAGKKFYGIDTITDTFVVSEVEEKYENSTFLGFARDRTLVRYLRIGTLDIEGFIMAESTIRLSLFLTFVIESDLDMLRKESSKVGREINDVTYICDLDGSSIKQIAHKCVAESSVEFLRLLQDIYPSVWRRVLVINAPFAFDKIFNAFKYLLKTPFLEKLDVIPKGSTGEVLLRYIDEDVLPAFLGGKRVDSKGNPDCSEFVKPGGKIPTNVYLSNQIPLLMPSDPGVTAVHIRPGCVYNHSLLAKEVGGELRLEYRTENGSLDFSVLHKEAGSNLESPNIPSTSEVLDESEENSGLLLIGGVVRTQTHLTPIIMKGKIISRGVYILRFDNRCSWFTSKNLILRASIVPP